MENVDENILALRDRFFTVKKDKRNEKKDEGKEREMKMKRYKIAHNFYLAIFINVSLSRE